MRTRVEFTLPWPPSMNTYWRVVNGRSVLSRRGRTYRGDVIQSLGTRTPMLGRLRVEVVAHAPDHRRRDLDNLHKAPLDALEHAAVYADDGQIDDLRIRRGEVDKDNPRLEVVIVEVGEESRARHRALRGER